MCEASFKEETKLNWERDGGKKANKLTEPTNEGGIFQFVIMFSNSPNNLPIDG